MENVVLYKKVFEVFKVGRVKNHSTYPPIKPLDAVSDITEDLFKVDLRYNQMAVDEDFFIPVRGTSVCSINKIKENEKVRYNLSGVKNVHLFYEFEPVNMDTNGDIFSFVDGDTFLKHIGNPFSHVIVRRTTLVLTKSGDKFKLSIYNFQKERKVGAKYFWKKRYNKHYIFNDKFGNFFTVKNEQCRGKKTSTIRQNDFDSLTNIELLIRSHVLFSNKSHVLRGKLNHDSGIKDEITKLTNILSSHLLGTGKSYVELKPLVLDWFIKKNNIKHPNDFEWLFNHYPGKKVLKKFDMNLGKTVLVSNGVYSKYTNMLINRYGYINFDLYKQYLHLFGDHSIKKLDIRLFRKFDNWFNVPPKDQFKLLTPKEVDRVINLYNLSVESMSLHELDIADHIKLKYDLKECGINVTILADTTDSFFDEHHLFAEELTKVKRTIGTNFYYPNEFLEFVELPISYNGMAYTPYVLKTDLDYQFEGSHQKHCVGGYHNKFDSYIVSVRDDNDVRMTVEFRLNSSTEFKAIQSRMKFNSLPEGDWVMVDNIIRTKMDQTLKLNLFKTPKITKYNIITGDVVKVEQEGGVDPEDMDKLLTDKNLHRFDYDLLF